MASPDRARHDVNLKPSLIAVSNADGESPVSLWADPNTHGLVISATISGADGALLDGSNSAIRATVLSLVSSKPLTVAIVDTAGAQINSFGGGTQYTTGAATPGSPIGTMPVFDNAGTIAKVSASQGLPVNIVGGAGGGTSAIDGAAWVAATTTGTPMMGARDDTAPGTVAEDKVGIVRITTNRAVHSNLRDASGNELGIAAAPLQVSLANTAANATAVKVDGSAVTQPVSGTVTANAGSNLNTSLLALESGGNLATLAGAIVSQGTAIGTIKELMVAGSVTTNAPTYVTGQISPLSLDTVGLLRVSLKDTPSNTNNLNVNLAASAATVTITGTVTTTPPANASTNVTQFGSNNVVTGTGVGGVGIPRVTVSSDSAVTANAGTNLNTSLLQLDATGVKLNVAQAAALGANTGPMVQGSVTTNAPSYTTGNINPLSLDTAGLLRASLKDTPSNTNNFNVNLAASAATVTVSATNLSTNVAQFGGTNVVTGTGASGVGTPRVTVANDSNILTTQSGTWNIGTLTSITNNVNVIGTKTNNNAVPGATNVGVLPAVANAAAPTYIEGNQVALSTDLTGALRISGGGGGTQYAELSTTSPATATAILGRYQTAPPSLTNGQMFMPQLDSSGNLKVTGSLSIGGTTDGATFTAGSSTFTGVGGVYNDAITNLAAGQQGGLRLTADRRLKVDIGQGATGIQVDNIQQIGGSDVATTNDGTQLVSIAGPTGDAIDTTGNAVNAFITNPTTSPVNVLSLNSQNQSVNGILSSGATNGLILNLAYPAQSAYITVLSNNALSAFLGILLSYDGVTFQGSQSLPLRQISLSGNPTVTATTFTAGTTYAYIGSLAGVKAIKAWFYSYTSGSASFQITASPNALTQLDNGIIQMGTNLASVTNNYNPLVAAATYVTSSGSALNFTKEIVNAANSTGTGIQAVGILAQLDDVSPTVITENQFGNVRMSSDRGLLIAGVNTSGISSALVVDTNKNLQITLRDAAGNSRGANVTAASQLVVSDTGLQTINNVMLMGEDIAIVAPGVQLNAIAGPTGDPLNTIGDALEVAVTRTVPVADESNAIFINGIKVIPQFATVSTAASGATAIVTAQAGKSIRVLVSTLVANAAVNVKWQSGTVDITGLYYLAANTGVADAYAPVGHFQTLINQALNINLSGSIAVGGKITYVVV